MTSGIWRGRERLSCSESALLLPLIKEGCLSVLASWTSNHSLTWLWDRWAGRSKERNSSEARSFINASLWSAFYLCVLHLLVASPTAVFSEHFCRLLVSIVTGTVEQAAPRKGQWLFAKILLQRYMANHTPAVDSIWSTGQWWRADNQWKYCISLN